MSRDGVVDIVRKTIEEYKYNALKLCHRTLLDDQRETKTCVVPGNVAVKNYEEGRPLPSSKIGEAQLLVQKESVRFCVHSGGKKKK